MGGNRPFRNAYTGALRELLQLRDEDEVDDMISWSVLGKDAALSTVSGQHQLLNSEDVELIQALSATTFIGHQIMQERTERYERFEDEHYRGRLAQLAEEARALAFVGVRSMVALIRPGASPLSSADDVIGSIEFLDQTNQSILFRDVPSWASVLVDSPATEQGGRPQFSFDEKIGELETLINALRGQLGLSSEHVSQRLSLATLQGTFASSLLSELLSGPSEPLIGSSGFVAAWDAAGRQPDRLDSQMQVLYSTILALAARNSSNPFVVGTTVSMRDAQPGDEAGKTLLGCGKFRSHACATLTEAALASLDQHATLRLPSPEGLTALLILEYLLEGLEDEGHFYGPYGARPVVNAYVGALRELYHQEDQRHETRKVWPSTSLRELPTSVTAEMAPAELFAERYTFSLKHLMHCIGFSVSTFTTKKSRQAPLHEEAFETYVGSLTVALDLMPPILEGAISAGLLDVPYIRRHIRSLHLIVCLQTFLAHQIIRERWEACQRFESEGDQSRHLLAKLREDARLLTFRGGRDFVRLVNPSAFMDGKNTPFAFKDIPSWASVLVEMPTTEQGGPPEFSMDTKVAELEVLLQALQSIQFFQGRPCYASGTTWLYERLEEVRRQREETSGLTGVHV
ncbi:Zn(2)-C7 fungal-type transcription factor [Pseudohyphozyma bogoriensis]|nr:Zn(2)-C7 fungal-type transcription factor [Pseudohyphozyma bogoriensis]